MSNIVTIYRFNTPFLDLNTEKKNLLSVIKKIEKSLQFDWLFLNNESSNDQKYFKETFNFIDSLWKIEMFYLDNLDELNYYLPIFKLNIFIDDKFIIDLKLRKRLINFLNNIFECFDGLNEKEFLIDMDSRINYKKYLFYKVWPDYDFSDLEFIKNKFESKNWMSLVEDFIKTYSDKDFVLTREKSEYYHTLHGVFLYFIYLVFLMYQNIQKTEILKNNIEKEVSNELFKWQLDLMEKRLSSVENIHNDTFEKYKNRLELFFKMF